MTSDDLLALLAKLLVAGGSGAATAYGLFQFFGKRWIDNRFARQQAELNAQFAERLQAIRSEQERAARYVQSEIDQGIHRAKKLYDKEFDVLSEAWLRLDGVSHIGSKMALDWISPACKVTAEEWTHRHESLEKLANDFADFVERNGIFMPAQVDAKFEELSSKMSAFFCLLGPRDVLAEKDKEKLLGDYLSTSAELVEQLRQLVRSRLWSAGQATVRADAD